MKKTPKKTTKKATPKKKQLKKKAAPKPKKPMDIIITSPVNPSMQIIMASELSDDSIIEQSLMSEVLPYYVYIFCENKSNRCSPETIQAHKCPHRKISGLSAAGTNETVRRLNKDKASGYNIRVNPEHITIERDIEQNDEKGVSVTVYAENLIDGNSAWGTKFEPYKKVGKNGQYKNDFAVEKALSKAERNAKGKLIPKTVVAKMIERIILGEPDRVAAIAPLQTTAQLLAPLPPAPSSVTEVQALIRQAIGAAKTKATILEIDAKTQASDNFSKTFKAEVRDLASSKIDKLNELEA